MQFSMQFPKKYKSIRKRRNTVLKKLVPSHFSLP
jgi:hypothetical protein